VLEHISSSIVKDVARHGGNVMGMVPDCVVPMLADALQEEKS
jgi:pantetheine-phosphate adenylyltransferase